MAVLAGPCSVRQALSHRDIPESCGPMTGDSSTTPASLLADIRSVIASFETIRAGRTSRDGRSFSRAQGPVRPPAPADAADDSSEKAMTDTTERYFTEHSAAIDDGRDAMRTAVADAEPADGTEGGPAPELGFQPVPRGLRAREVDRSAKIMIVDDEPLNVMTLRQHLRMEGYERFATTTNARDALHLIRAESPDVLLLDVRMPDISGIDILRVVGLDPALQHIPVLILTASTDPVVRKQALEMGASDFLQKPVDPDELLPRVRNAIILKKHHDMISGEAARLEQQVERRTRQLEATRQQLILCLARAAEHRDNDTGNHVIRVGRYTAIIARRLGYPEDRLEMLEHAAQLHDVGKIGIPDAILFKPGRLDPDEYDLIKRHCSLGKQIIQPIPEREWNILKTHTRIGESMLHVRSSQLLMLAARIAQTHHERWDGKGYPLGLKGEDIPLEGRIVAVADVFDALSSRRSYKPPFPREKCFEIIGEGRETQFDPRVVDAFFGAAEEIIEVQLMLMDDEERIPRCEWEQIARQAVTDPAPADAPAPPEPDRGSAPAPPAS